MTIGLGETAHGAIVAIMVLMAAGLAPAAAPPATQPTADQATIARWIGELGSEDYPTREAATAALVKAGAAAMPALKAATTRETDPETAGRVAVLIARLSGPGAPTGRVLAAAAPILTARTPRIMQARVVEPGRLNEVSVTCRDVARVVLRRSGTWIEMNVSAKIDGRVESETYGATGELELAKKYPAAQQLYDAVLNEMAGGKEEGVTFRTWFDQPAALKE